MKLSSVRYFLTVAEHKSFTRASEILFVTQPTLSRQIQLLEEELGTKLFYRDYKSLRLTKDGELFRKEAEKLIAECDHISRMFKTESTPEKTKPRKLRVAYQKHFNSQAIYHAMQVLVADTPGLDFILSQDIPQNLIASLQDDKLDAIFVLDVFLPTDPEGLCIIPYTPNRLKLIVPDRHPLADREHISVKELRDEDFVLLNRTQSPTLVDYVKFLCKQQGFMPHANHYVNDAQEILQMVGSMQGISFLHSGMPLKQYEQNYHIRAIDIDEADLKSNFVLVYKESNDNPSLRHLLSLLELA